MVKKTCSRGHVFNSDCPVCPKCWPGFRMQSDFPKLASPALRALSGAKIRNLAQLAKRTEAEVLALHGVGPDAVLKLRRALKDKGLSFKKVSN
ncbi:MAG TPA: hypothetical protein VLD37_01210 [Candidatus Bilamarchaeum sp.]|nr:hypothetical protein [Candidatus Bilamarchaeum sp.]